MNKRNATSTQIESIAMMAIIYDCYDPKALADFYAKLLGGTVFYDPYDAISVKIPGASIRLGFQYDEFYKKPVWLGSLRDQQHMAHLDLKVDCIKSSVEYALALGATMPENQICQPDWGVQWVMLFDPSGRPICFFEEY